jgi:hypothetical protein
MLDTILQEIREKVKNKLPFLIGNLEETLRWEEFERSLRALTQEITGTVMGPVLNHVLHDEALLKRLREAAGTMGYKYKEHRPLTVRVLDGVEVAVQSPYFTKKGRKRGKKKRGPNGRGCHLLLEVLGFIGQSRLRISVKVATYSGLKVATDRSVATRDLKLRESGHFGSRFSDKKVAFRIEKARRSRFGVSLPGWVGGV